MSEAMSLQLIVAELKKALDEAYERGRKDALDAVVRAASAGEASREASAFPLGDIALTENSERQRAPRGSVKKVVERALNDKASEGATVREIMGYRLSEGEKMIVDSSVRGELRKGAKAGDYIERGEKWLLSIYRES